MLDDEPSETSPSVEDLVTDQEKPLEEDHFLNWTQRTKTKCSKMVLRRSC